MDLRGKVLVANTGDDTLTYIDFTEKKKERIDLLNLSFSNDRKVRGLGGNILGPHDLVDSGQEYVYCTNVYDNSLLKMDLVSREIIDIISVGRYPSCVKYYDGHLFIANTDSNSISVIDEDKFSLVESIPTGEKPVYIEIDKFREDIYVVNSNGYSIDMIGLYSNRCQRLRLKDNPIKITIFQDLIYILSNASCPPCYISNISIFSLSDYKEKSSTMLKGYFSNMLRINSREIIFITNMENGYLYRMDAERNDLLSKTRLKGMPNQLGWDGDNILYISNISTDTLTVFDINNNAIIGNIEVGKEPNGILILP